MTTKDTGGSAFPSANAVTVGDCRTNGHPGMTLREKFADSALQGILGNAYWNEHGPFNPMAVAQAAWEYADAMLAARKEES